MFDLQIAHDSGLHITDGRFNERFIQKLQEIAREFSLKFEPPKKHSFTFDPTLVTT